MIIFVANISLLAACVLLGNVLGWKIGEWTVRAGEKWGVLSHVNERSSHTRPTSRLGGLAVAAGFFGPYLILVCGLRFIPASPYGWGGNIPLILWIMLGAAILFVVGLADDLRDLPPVVKLAGQVLGLAPLVLAPLHFIDLEFPPVPPFSPQGLALASTLLWVLFFINAYNFMDGMDGFAVRFAMAVCFWLFLGAAIQAARQEQLFDLRLELFMVPLLGSACTGFYRVNRPPARVFLGDGGSLLVGYLLAAQVILADGEYYAARAGFPEGGPTVPALAVWIFLLPFTFDVVLTLLRRARLGENLLKPHRSHLYQRLLITGMGHREVLLLNLRYFRICGILGIGVILLHSATARVLLSVAAFGTMLHYWRLVLDREAKINRK